LFLLAPIISLTLSLLGWTVIPFSNGIVISDLSLGIMFLLAISSLGVFAVLFSGWASNSKYSLLGSLRSTAQLITYEVFFGLLILIIIFLTESLNFVKLIESQQSIWYIIPLFPLSLLFLIAIIAETNRPPFDLVEAVIKSIR